MNTIKIFDSNNNLKAIMVYENGNRVGEWKIWDEKGNIAQVISY